MPCAGFVLWQTSYGDVRCFEELLLPFCGGGALNINVCLYISPFRSMLMTACDISAITKPWPVQKRVKENPIYLFVLVVLQFFGPSLICSILLCLGHLYDSLFVSYFLSHVMELILKLSENILTQRHTHEVFTWLCQTVLVMSFWAAYPHICQLPIT